MNRWCKGRLYTGSQCMESWLERQLHHQGMIKSTLTSSHHINLQSLPLLSWQLSPLQPYSPCLECMDMSAGHVWDLILILKTLHLPPQSQSHPPLEQPHPNFIFQPCPPLTSCPASVVDCTCKMRLFKGPMVFDGFLQLLTVCNIL